MAKLSFNPIFRLVTPDRNVTIPSGKLCTINAINESIPSFNMLFSPSIFLSRMFIIKYPDKNEAIVINEALKTLNLEKIVIIEGGRRSKTDIRIITVPEKAKIRLVVDFLPIFGTNTSNEPISVPKDAKNDNKMGINIFIIL